MSSSTTLFLAVALLGGLSVMAIAYVVIGPALLGGSRADKRIQAISKNGKTAKGKGVKDDNQQRRKAVQETLKQLENKQKERKKKRTINTLIEQSGRTMSTRSYWLFSLLAAGIAALLVAMSGVGWIAVVLSALTQAVHVPTLESPVYLIVAISDRRARCRKLAKAHRSQASNELVCTRTRKLKQFMSGAGKFCLRPNGL